MSQVFEQIFGRFKANQIVIATDGDAWLLKLQAPVAGYLSKLLVQQATGTPVAFKVDVLNAIGSQTPGEISTPGSVFPAGGAWQMTRVIPQQSGTAGQQVALFTPFGYPFRNMDGPDPTRSGVSQSPLSAGQTGYTNAQRNIYVLLQPASGAGANAQWEIAANMWSDI